MEEWQEANRANWDDRVPIHAASDFYDVEGWLAGGCQYPRPWEMEALGPVEGLDAVHLQCHFGVDSISLARLGACVTGLDFSGAAIATARGLAERAGLGDRARFVEADVLDAAEALAPASFDLVYVTLGALCWVSDVARWATQVRSLLRPGGRLFVHECHPLSLALADDQLEPEYSYFEEPTPWLDDLDVTYTDGEGRLSHTKAYSWNHSLGEILGALLARGLRIDRFEEHDWTTFQRFSWLVDSGGQRWETPPGRLRVPLSFTLVATLPG
jgi:SAM-dependent methyltransferase